jgi:hypothetical protein
MITRVRLASVAFVLLLVSASVSFAQQSDSTTTPRTGKLAHRGAIGGQVGASYMYGGGDFSRGAQPRFSFNGSFRYVSSPHWGWQVNPYFTWASYKSGYTSHIPRPGHPSDSSTVNYLTQIAGANAQLLYVRTKGTWTWHLGAGPAVYRVVLQNHRKVVKDPETFRHHQGTYLGATAEWGTEHFLRSLPNTSLEWTVGWHAAFAKRDDQFPRGYSDSPQVVEFRFGGHYYFDLVPGKKPGATPAPKK